MIKQFLILALLASAPVFAALPGPSVQPYFQQTPTSTVNPSSNVIQQNYTQRPATTPQSVTTPSASPATPLEHNTTTSPSTTPYQSTPRAQLQHGTMKPTPIPSNRLRASPLEHKSMTPNPLPHNPI